MYQKLEPLFFQSSPPPSRVLYEVVQSDQESQPLSLMKHRLMLSTKLEKSGSNWFIEPSREETYNKALKAPLSYDLQIFRYKKHLALRCYLHDVPVC